MSDAEGITPGHAEGTVSADAHLTDAQRATLRHWVAEGYNDHLTAALTAALACDDALRQARDALRELTSAVAADSAIVDNLHLLDAVAAARAALGDQT